MILLCLSIDQNLMIKCLSADKHSEESLEMLKILWFTNCLDGVDSDWIIACRQRLQEVEQHKACGWY